MATRLFSGVGLVLIVVLIIFGWNTLFTVGEWEQAIVIQLGEFKRTIQKPGLNWKYPFVQQVITLGLGVHIPEEYSCNRWRFGRGGRGNLLDIGKN